MSRLVAQVWGGVFSSLACLAISVPVLVVHFRGERLPEIPTGWWLACFAVFFAAFSATMWGMEVLPARVVAATLTLQSALAIVLVLTAPRAGWTSILLVFNAALSAYVVPPRATAVLIGVNSAAVAVAGAQVSSTAFEVAMVALLYVVLQAAGVLSVHAQLREAESRRRAAEANVRLRSASALLAESSRTEERLRIARELHDLLGHQLTVLSLELEIASHRARGEEAAESVERARGLTHGLLADVRSTVGEMRRQGPQLRETLEAVVADLPEPAVHLRIADAVVADEALTAALVRCVQEVVTNTIRHAEAEHLWIEITAEDRSVVLETRDDGLGAKSVEMGHGLRGMAERLEELGGSVRFRGDDGFRVRAEVPAT